MSEYNLVITDRKICRSSYLTYGIEKDGRVAALVDSSFNNGEITLPKLNEESFWYKSVGPFSPNSNFYIIKTLTEEEIFIKENLIKSVEFRKVRKSPKYIPEYNYIKENIETIFERKPCFERAFNLFVNNIYWDTRSWCSQISEIGEKYWSSILNDKNKKVKLGEAISAEFNERFELIFCTISEDNYQFIAFHDKLKGVCYPIEVENCIPKRMTTRMKDRFMNFFFIKEESYWKGGKSAIEKELNEHKTMTKTRRFYLNALLEVLKNEVY